MAGSPVDLLLSPLLLAILGLAVGSFLNVVIYRLPVMLERRWWTDVRHQMQDGPSFGRIFGAPMPAQMQSAAAGLEQSLSGLAPMTLAQPSSRCPTCTHPIRWHHNIPLVSWLWLRARCADCGASIPSRYPLIETLCAALFAAIGWRFGPHPVALLWCGFAATLVALSFIDWDTTVLPDDLTLPLLWAGLVASASGWTIPLPQAVIGAAAGYLSLWVVYWLFKLATGKEGMGYGDFKLLAALGAWLGWPALLPIILAASILGAIVGIGMKIGGGLREGRYVPFGPFLAGAGAVVLLVGSHRALDWLGWS
jgi:leader peptidase (prepilin peptidase) / N-methyltransferase